MSSDDFPKKLRAEDFPKVTGKKKKPIYHCGLISDQILEAQFRVRGWEPIDLRLADSGPETLKHWLEGIRFGTIEADRQAEKFVELELKVYGLVGAVKKVDDKPAETALDLASMFEKLPPKRHTAPRKTKSKDK